MNEEKQIDEMSAEIREAVNGCSSYWSGLIAEHLHEQGYRKQSEGEWVKPTTINGRAFNIVHCSVCDGIPCGVDENTKYCPNCGAKMKGGE